MNKPNWHDEPILVNYQATDKNGKWFYYEYKPMIIDIHNQWKMPNGNIESAESNDDCKETLEERPCKT